MAPSTNNKNEAPADSSAGQSNQAPADVNASAGQSNLERGQSTSAPRSNPRGDDGSVSSRRSRTSRGSRSGRPRTLRSASGAPSAAAHDGAPSGIPRVTDVFSISRITEALDSTTLEADAKEYIASAMRAAIEDELAAVQQEVDKNVQAEVDHQLEQMEQGWDAYDQYQDEAQF